MKNHTNRFTGRVENYAKYRPSYPEQIIPLLEKKIGFDPFKDIADIGCGTGFLSRVFLNNGNIVFGVEPNREMRDMAEKLLSKFINFLLIEGTAEDTKLASKSVDIITVGQAFHWFDLKKAKPEFRRILRDNGHVVLVWNERKNSTQFMKVYNKLMKTLKKEYELAEKKIADTQMLKSFFGKSGYKAHTFANYQMLDMNGLKGRVQSVSYIPTEGEAFVNIMNTLKEIFDRYNNGGMVKLEYTTRIYIGTI